MLQRKISKIEVNAFKPETGGCSYNPSFFSAKKCRTIFLFKRGNLEKLPYRFHLADITEIFLFHELESV